MNLCLKPRVMVNVDCLPKYNLGSIFFCYKPSPSKASTSYMESMAFLNGYQLFNRIYIHSKRHILIFEVLLIDSQSFQKLYKF